MQRAIFATSQLCLVAALFLMLLGQASAKPNVLIIPTLDAANIPYQLITGRAAALRVVPILIGTAAPAHILTPSVTARGVVNMTAIAVVEAQQGAV
jgi:malate dehydrogenase (oxaloacetate-decarboxylating)(NADP+)